MKLNPVPAADYEAVWPGGALSVDRIVPAARPESLDGCTVALIWDYVFRGDEILPLIAEEIRRRFRDVKIVPWEVFGPTFGRDEAATIETLPARLRAHGVDVAVSGIGACGACTPATVRAAAVAERCGVATVSLVTDGFLAQAAAVAPGLGIPELPIARLVGHVDDQSSSELARNVLEVTVDAVIAALTTPVRSGGETPAARTFGHTEIVARGSFEQVNTIFEREGWSDGLPIVPPTHAKVDAFLGAAPWEEPDRVIGVLQPSGSALTVRNVAVNGVMAGCRPEYMPLLVAIAEVLADPAYGVEHSGDTTGADAQIILNGPIVAELGFNFGNGALRDGYRPNSTVGRFLRLILRNVARSLPGAGDKATFGHTWRVVLAENEAELAKLNWPTFSMGRGFAADESVVTIQRTTGSAMVGSIYGRDPEEIARNLADGLVRQSAWELAYTVGFAPATSRPMVLISPMVAKTIRKGGMSRDELRRAIFNHARLPAWKVERYVGHWTSLVPGKQTLAQLVEKGLASPQFAVSDDPERLVPVVERETDILLLVSGDPFRSNAVVFGSNGMHGGETSRVVRNGPAIRVP